MKKIALILFLLITVIGIPRIPALINSPNSPTHANVLTVSSQVPNGTTALEVTKSKFSVKTTGEGKNAFVTEIDGVVAQEAKRQFWALYINGAQSQVGAGSYVVKPGDKIEWKLETY